MSKNQKMEFKLNSSPNLEMSDITKQLFNRNFHSDIQFSVQGKIIYAHSLELIKRSVVFEEQFEKTMGDKKLIPIIDYRYESFLEFIRFIYTDDCEINNDNYLEILKLATKYQVIKLENRIINSIKLIDDLKFFEHYICDKYELPRNYMNQFLAAFLAELLVNKEFISLHPDAVDEILKFESVSKDVTELQIFIAVAEWISSQCEKHLIALSEGRQRWDRLIRKIRFPTIPIQDLRECYRKYPGLLTDSDCMSIGEQIVFGASNTENDLWISKSREKFRWPIQTKRIFEQGENFKTILSVSEETILNGLRIAGCKLQYQTMDIEILETDDNIDASQKLTFQQAAPIHFDQVMISLGESLRLKPKCKYTINIKYLEAQERMKWYCRQNRMIINDPGEAVNIIQASANMLEMFFKPAKD